MPTPSPSGRLEEQAFPVEGMPWAIDAQGPLQWSWQQCEVADQIQNLVADMPVRTAKMCDVLSCLMFDNLRPDKNVREITSTAGKERYQGV